MLSAKRSELLKAVFEHPFNHASCLLCADPLTAESSTEEHVIPKWVQKKYDLWNESLGLLNDTSIQYRQLTVPTSKRFNNNTISKVEPTLKVAILSVSGAVIPLR